MSPPVRRIPRQSCRQAAAVLAGRMAFGSELTALSLKRRKGLVPPGSTTGMCRRPALDRGITNVAGHKLPSTQHEHAAGDRGIRVAHGRAVGLGGTVAGGRKSGSFVRSLAPHGVPRTCKSECLVSFELGSKSRVRLPDPPATLDVSGFLYNDYNEAFPNRVVTGFHQDGTTSSYSLANENQGKSRLCGLETQRAQQMPVGFLVDVNARSQNTRTPGGTAGDGRRQNGGAGGISAQIDLAGSGLPPTSRCWPAARPQQCIDFDDGERDGPVLGSYRYSYVLSPYTNRTTTFLADTAAAVDHAARAAAAGYPDRQPHFCSSTWASATRPVATRGTSRATPPTCSTRRSRRRPPWGPD